MMKPIKAWTVMITDKKGKDRIYRPNGRMFIGTEREAKLNADTTLGDCYFSAANARPVCVTITIEEG